jgi:flagellar hook-associated protein 3 FlgL
MRINPNITSDILTAISQAEMQQQKAVQEVATGKRVSVPSDDPAAAAALVQNLAQASQTDQYLQNTSSVEGLLQTGDSALSSVVTVLNQAIGLGVQGTTGTLSASDRQAVAQQVQGIFNQVVQLANSSYQGNYIFAGTATTAPPFVIDPTQPSGVQYNGNAGANNVEIANGRSIQINLPGSQVFQSAGGDVMGSLQQLITALQTGNTTASGTATTQLRSALDSLSQQRVFYGNAINQLTSNQSFLQQEKVNLQTQQNGLVGIDTAQAATDLSQAEMAYNAGLAAAAKVLPPSLMDYLK